MTNEEYKYMCKICECIIDLIDELNRDDCDTKWIRNEVLSVREDIINKNFMR